MKIRILLTVGVIAPVISYYECSTIASVATPSYYTKTQDEILKAEPARVTPLNAKLRMSTKCLSALPWYSEAPKKDFKLKQLSPGIEKTYADGTILYSYVIPQNSCLYDILRKLAQTNELIKYMKNYGIEANYKLINPIFEIDYLYVEAIGRAVAIV